MIFIERITCPTYTEPIGSYEKPEALSKTDSDVISISAGLEF